jgi:hypothetical protein
MSDDDGTGLSDAIDSLRSEYANFDDTDIVDQDNTAVIDDDVGDSASDESGVTLTDEMLGLS